MVRELLEAGLGLRVLGSYGRAGGGCINEGAGYNTDKLGPIFVKTNKKREAKTMFEGEFESLKALEATQTIRVPKPIKVLENPKGGAHFVAEYIEMNRSQDDVEFGRQMARLHLFNAEMMKRPEERADWVKGSAEPVKQFGFHATTCCGYIAQKNTWNPDWVNFYTQQRLRHQLDLLKSPELEEMWPRLVEKIPSLFTDAGDITPALLHGDLWGGNWSGTENNQPVVFDPATFYGHAEFDFGIATMFGGLSRDFWRGYNELIPEAPGFQKRLPLYQLFHHLNNHWNHFGRSYAGSSINLMKKICNS